MMYTRTNSGLLQVVRYEKMKQDNADLIGNRESVWDYPRPPRLEPTGKHIQVYFNDLMIADSLEAYRVLEKSHPPVYYLPQKDILTGHLRLMTDRITTCERKGAANYFTVVVGEKVTEHAAWSYFAPNDSYKQIKNYIAFYPGMMDPCLVNGEVVKPQPGDFYGGWITGDINGPFKGEIVL